jgi:hypothetical protein
MWEKPLLEPASDRLTEAQQRTYAIAEVKGREDDREREDMSPTMLPRLADTGDSGCYDVTPGSSHQY